MNEKYKRFYIEEVDDSMLKEKEIEARLEKMIDDWVKETGRLNKNKSLSYRIINAETAVRSTSEIGYQTNVATVRFVVHIAYTLN